MYAMVIEPHNIWNNGAIPARLGCIYLCCHLHQARLMAPMKFRGSLLRRPSQDPISPILTHSNGTSASDLRINYYI